MSKKLFVPDIGEFENVEIIEILVKKGEKINKNDPVVTLESDKSSVEVPSNSSGTIKNINVKIGDKVSQGDLILTLDSNEENENQKEFKKTNDKVPSITEKIIQEAESTKKEKKERVIIDKEHSF